MTPDRPDHTPDDDAQHGVLSDTGSLETTGIGILGGATEQVSVELPGEIDEDDFGDDDVVGDEVPFAIELSTDTIEGEIVDDEADHDEADDDEADDERDDVERDDVDLDDVARTTTHEWTIEAVEASGWSHDEARDEFYGAAAGPELVVEDPAADGAVAAEGSADEFVAEIAAAEPDAGPADEPHLIEEPEAAASLTAVFDALLAEGAKPAADPEPPATTGSTPATRWAAQHPETPGRRLDRAHAVERVHPRPDVTVMTSKRLGEFEAGRESADLLTADRLLDPHQVVRPEPEGAWQHFLYSISGHRINLGDGKRARARKALDRRIAAPLAGGARFVPVLSRKGGVGKTTVTTLLGMALADARDDRVIAVDANPDRGTLAERIARTSGKTVRDLVRTRGDVAGYNDLSTIVARDETRLDVLASDSDPRVSEAFSDRDYHDVASLAAHYYSIVLTDTGTGIVHSVMGATLDLADQLVIVAGLSVDEARLASETLTWLETNGYAEQVRGAVVVLNNARPGAPLVRPEELESHFRSRVRSVVRMPYDPHIAAGSAISFRELLPATRVAARELAAAVVEGLRALAPAA